MFGITWYAIFVPFAWQGTWCKTTIFCQDGVTAPLASFIDVGPAKKQPGTRLEKKRITLRRAEWPCDKLTYPMKHSPTLRGTSPLYNEHNGLTIKWPTLQRTGRPYNKIKKAPRPTVTRPTRNHTTLPRIVQTTQQRVYPPYKERLSIMSPIWRHK